MNWLLEGGGQAPHPRWNKNDTRSHDRSAIVHSPNLHRPKASIKIVYINAFRCRIQCLSKRSCEMQKRGPIRRSALPPAGVMRLTEQGPKFRSGLMPDPCAAPPVRCALGISSADCQANPAAVLAAGMPQHPARRHVQPHGRTSDLRSTGGGYGR